MTGALESLFLLVLATLQATGKEMCLYSGCNSTLQHARLHVSPLSNSSGVGFTLCGKLCQQEAGALSFNYNRVLALCQCLGQTRQAMPGNLIQDLDWYHGTVEDINEDSNHSCSCHHDFHCSVEARALLRCAPRDAIYGLRVYTGNIADATSPVDAYIIFYGTFDTKEVHVRSPDGVFNIGSNDYFEMAGTYLGAPEKLDVRTTGPTGDGWYLDKIVVTSNLNSIRYVFDFYVWFDTDPGYSTRHVRSLSCINC